jgi:hypothetical protein
MGATEFTGPTQNTKKIIGTPNQPIKTIIFPKNKYVAVKMSENEPNIRMTVTCGELFRR